MRRKNLFFALKLAISVGLLLLLYRRIDFGALKSQFRNLAVPPLALFFALLFANTSINTTRWKMLLAADGVAVRLRTLFRSHMIGTFFNVFLPSNIGGDVYRVYDIARHSGKAVSTFTSVFAERFFGFAALATLGLAFSLGGYGLIPGRQWLLFPLALFSLLAAAAWVLFRPAGLRGVLRRIGLARWPRLQMLIEGFLGSMAAYRARPAVLVKVMGLGFLFQFLIVVAVYLLSRALRLEIRFLYFCVFVPAILLMEAIPLSIYGLGLRDSGYVIFFTQIGHGREEAAAMSLLYVAASLIYSSIGGVLFAWRRIAGGVDDPS